MSTPETSKEATPSENGSAQYGSYYYSHDCGIPYERNEHWLNFFDGIAENLIRDLHPASVLDAGCAMGFLVEALRKRGVEAWGIDVSEYGISQVRESVREYCSVASLTEPLERKYDLITCIEVVEHISPGDARQVIGNLCAATDRLLLSTTPHDYSEATHVNVQAPEAWSAALAAEGFLRDFDHDASYLTPWASLYTRREEPLAETVRRYDQSWWRLRWEVSQMRDTLVTLHERLEGLQSGAPGERVGLLQELEQSREEVLRLRDLLINRDAELGAATGRLTEIEEGRRASLAGRMKARILITARHAFQVLRKPNA